MSSTTTGFVTAPDGVRLHYESMGDGARLVVAPNGTYLRDELAPLARNRRVVCFDLRNRGQSDATDRGGILEDVNDTFAVINHFTDGPVDVIGHSFAALLVALVARHHASRVRTAVMIGPLGMDPNREFAPPLSNRDETFDRVMRGLGALLPRQAEYEPEAFCRAAWDVLRPLYVTDPADALRVRWERCELPNERSAMRYFNAVTLPSIRALTLSAGDFALVQSPMLIVHGNKDRSAPYGGGREWAMALPNARLLTVDGAGHAPWIEDPECVLPAIASFLDGTWPDGAEQVTSLVPAIGDGR